MAALGTIAEYSSLVHDMFTTDGRNAAGIYGVRFFIRGKPWVVDVDD